MAEYRLFRAIGDTGAKAGIFAKDDGSFELVVRNGDEQEIRIPTSEERARAEMSSALRNPNWYIKNRRLK